MASEGVLLQCQNLGRGFVTGQMGSYRSGPWDGETVLSYLGGHTSHEPLEAEKLPSWAQGEAAAKESERCLGKEVTCHGWLQRWKGPWARQWVWLLKAENHPHLTTNGDLRPQCGTQLGPQACRHRKKFFPLRTQPTQYLDFTEPMGEKRKCVVFNS